MAFHLIPKSMRAETWKIPGTPPARINNPNPGDGRLARRYGANLKFPTQGSVRHAGNAICFKTMSTNTDRGSKRVSHPGEYYGRREQLCGSTTGYIKRGDKLVSPKLVTVRPRFTMSRMDRMFKDFKLNK